MLCMQWKLKPCNSRPAAGRGPATSILQVHCIAGTMWHKADLDALFGRPSNWRFGSWCQATPACQVSDCNSYYVVLDQVQPVLAAWVCVNEGET